MSNLGYVVIEYNQASGQPDLLPYSELCWDLQDAKERMEDAREETASVGRGETYRIAEVVLLDEDEQTGGAR